MTRRTVLIPLAAFVAAAAGAFPIAAGGGWSLHVQLPITPAPVIPAR